MELSHINNQGRACMVDVTGKQDTERIATARAVIRMQADTLDRIRNGGIKKGDVLAVAQVAGIMGAKQTPALIPMCHPLMLTGVDIQFEMDEENPGIIVNATVKTAGKTGVEMEAITAASIAALTIYDMSKAIDRWMTIEEIKLLEKAGGKSGHLQRPMA